MPTSFSSSKFATPQLRGVSVGPGLPRTFVRCAALSHAGPKLVDGGPSTLGTSM